LRSKVPDFGALLLGDVVVENVDGGGDEEEDDVGGGEDEGEVGVGGGEEVEER
jgi:hypothetical protein